MFELYSMTFLSICLHVYNSDKYSIYLLNHCSSHQYLNQIFQLNPQFWGFTRTTAEGFGLNTMDWNLRYVYPGLGSKENFLSKIDNTVFISIMENLWPMHMCGPYEKGRNVIDPRFSCCMKRLGSNSSGLSQFNLQKN